MQTPFSLQNNKMFAKIKFKITLPTKIITNVNQIMENAIFQSLNSNDEIK
jgi:hypothetical protein